MQFVGEAGSGHAIVLDGKPENGGRDTGARPMELVLVALAGCTAMDVKHVLMRMRQDVSGLQVKVQAERADEHPKVYTDIQLEYVVRGRNLSEKAVTDAVKLSQDKYCSVSAMLAETAQIGYTIKIMDETGA
jgi:putative redox protein